MNALSVCVCVCTRMRMHACVLSKGSPGLWPQLGLAEQCLPGLRSKPGPLPTVNTKAWVLFVVLGSSPSNQSFKEGSAEQWGPCPQLTKKRDQLGQELQILGSSIRLS